MPADLRPVAHAPENARGDGASEVRCGKCAACGADTERAHREDQTRKGRPAWRALRDVGATVLASVVGSVYGAASAWAHRLGVDPKVTARFLVEGGHSPHLADLLMLEQEIRVELWRALLKKDTTDTSDPAQSVERHLMLVGADVGDVNREVLEALRDGRISPQERTRIVREIDEAVARLAAMKRDLDREGGR